MMFLRKKIVVDIYDPIHLENLERSRNREDSLKRYSWRMNIKRLIMHMKIGDFYICASEKQRDLWLGSFSVLGRINPWLYKKDPTYREFIDIVPFGLSAEKPKHKRNVLKGIKEGISPKDKIVFWYSGIWPWFDPYSVIRAMASIAQDRSDIKLIFFGMKSPDKLFSFDVYEPVRKAKDFSVKLGLLNKNVFFFEDWVPYAERQNYLLEADIVVSLYRQHLEANFAFRTRVLDYIWANLPIISTKGDVLSDMIEKHKLGITVDYENDKQIVDAIIKLVDDKIFYADCKANLAKISSNFEWNRVCGPLLKFCKAPRISTDKKYGFISLLIELFSYYWIATILMLRMSRRIRR